MTDFTTTRTDLLCDPLDNQALRQLLKPRLLPGDGLLAEHFQATAAQSRALSRVLLARAATTFVCQPDQYQENQILGLATPSPSQRSRGLVAHSTLALTTTGKPCGLLDLAYSGPDPRSPAPARRGSRPAEAQEDHQWQVSLASVGARLPAPTEVILIQDCEADYYDYLATPRPAHLHLLLRATHDRVIERLSPDTAGESQLQSVALFTLAAAAPVLGELSVLVPRRTATRTQLATPARQAHLMVRSQEVTLLRPPGSLAEARQLTLRVLEASERELPAGETPV
ncbi:MAG: hypothetical protein FJX77_07645, partial [Armatimonadetes bacterium]|nr:hypothetical protein [Armatimonadota bacterium]